MLIRGINYDVGTYTTKDSSSRPTFDEVVVRREMEVISSDLHCNAVRIYGQEVSRLVYAAECALAAGLEVWLSPQLHNAGEQQTLAYLAECARAAEALRERFPRIVFVVGCELTFFMNGLVLGDDSFERMKTLMSPWRLIKNTVFKGSFHKRLNVFLRRAAGVVREEFRGPVTYASGPWEEVDWAVFDFVGVDYYRDGANRLKYAEGLRKYMTHDKPLVVTEFGCCTYQGAEDKGGYGWAIVDRSQTPRRLKRDVVRDESVQAAQIVDVLHVFEQEKIHGGFVFTFVMETYPHTADPIFDLDRGSFGIVKPLGAANGVTYPDMHWEPKQAFSKIAEAYTRMHRFEATQAAPHEKSR